MQNSVTQTTICIIPVTRRVKVYIRFVEMCVTGRRERPYVRINVSISGTIKARRLRLSIQILDTDAAQVC